MLILTRKIGEKIVVGNNVIIEISEIRGEKVKLGIDAPRDVPVYREEISYRRTQNKETGETK